MTLASTVQVLYGSQTGNAESIAKHLHEEAISRGFDSRVAVLDDYEKVEWMASSVLVVIVSTTGDGDFPDNTTKFFRWTRRGKKEELAAAFDGKKFAVLALGDTNYTNFCQTGKRIERRLIELGATTFVNKGLADDATGLEAVIDPWVSNLWSLLPTLVTVDEVKAKSFALRALHPTSAILKKQKLDTDASTSTKDPTDPVRTVTASAVSVPEPMDVDVPAHYTPVKITINTTGVPTKGEEVTGAAMLPTEYLKVAFTDQSREPAVAKHSLFHLFNKASVPTSDPFSYTANHLFDAKIVGHRYLTGPKALKRVLEVTFNIKGLNWQTPAGGVIGIAAPNPDDVVLPLLKRLGVESSTILNVSLSNGESGVGDAPYTAYEAFRYFWDLNPPLRKPLLRVMAEYATDEDERATLLHLTSPGGATLFKLLKQSSPSLADLFATFPSVIQIPLNRLFESLTRLQPRFYSISRIDSVSSTISVAFNIVEYTNSATNQPVVGLCSTYLESLVKSGSTDLVVPLFPKPNVVFAPPADATRPMVLIAAGTGITPFLSFLQSREVAKATGTVIGETILFHGRRFADLAEGDRIYGAELDEYFASGVLTRFVEVTSREAGGVKYVQESVVEEGKAVWDVIANGGSVFVCGSVDMARDVHTAIGKVVLEKGGVEGDAGVKAFLKGLTSEGRYLKEIWS
ncbi:UNVERIFIED_CONTAM: hypothetical protein HDU68_001628 [Siphonaria sp. JEL0065]|nr:hypothetical protein HDU68_001628 [Siphonaria sp. JEL0065]